MMGKSKLLPQHRLEDAIYLRKLGVPSLVDYKHQDDYYLFFIQQDGKSSIAVDFVDYTLNGPSVAIIAPGQVHTPNSTNRCQGYVLAISAYYLAEKSYDKLRYLWMTDTVISVTSEAINLLFDILYLLEKLKQEAASLETQVHLSNALVSELLVYFGVTEESSESNRMSEITTQFKQLLQRKYRLWHNPKAYAEALNISTSYLYDTLMTCTSVSPSEWILQIITINAQRLLFYTEQPIKEIAYNLGYTDYAYFCRVFKRRTGYTPKSFRLAYRLSNSK